MKITIRKATPNDWQILQKLNYEVFEDNYQYDKFLNKPWLFSKEGIKYCKNVVSRKDYGVKKKELPIFLPILIMTALNWLIFIRSKE